MPEQQTRENLQDIMQSAHQRTLELIDGLSPEQLIGPKLPILNPILWEIGHIGWFHENFILRKEYGHSPLLERGDDLYDSIAIEHKRRWDLPLYSLQEMGDYLKLVLDACLERLEQGLVSERDSYLYQFTTFHEDMHGEAFTWARQTLGYPTPSFGFHGFSNKAHWDQKNHSLPEGDALIPGGCFDFGSPRDAAFYFDNEKWAHSVNVAPFRMAKAPLTNREYLDFVRYGGYEKDSIWSQEGLDWRNKVGARCPIYWRKNSNGGWDLRRFEKWIELPLDEPVIHVCWHEANAFCKWAGRRLPTEAEWEFSATMVLQPGGGLVKCQYPWGNDQPNSELACLDGYTLGCVPIKFSPNGQNSWGCVQLIGNVWEWTSDIFSPFPDFRPDDYKEYSEPLFGSTKVLRGGAWATRSRYIDGIYRNYFQPHRRDIFAGFRTCAL
jgi:iron(II)-dependent oxidoreductase